MNKIRIFLIVNMVLCFSITAQNATEIVPLDTNIFDVDNAYMKDLDNEMDKYVGTWLYENSNEEFEIEFEKLEHVQFESNIYEDLLVGEFRYKDGIELINTLPQMTTLNGRYHHISGRRIVHNYKNCDDCSSATRRFELFIRDPERKYIHAVIILKYMENTNPQELKVFIKSTGMHMEPYEDAPSEMRVPFGEYVLIKQL